MYATMTSIGRMRSANKQTKIYWRRNHGPNELRGMGGCSSLLTHPLLRTETWLAQHAGYNCVSPAIRGLLLAPPPPPPPTSVEEIPAAARGGGKEFPETRRLMSGPGWKRTNQTPMERNGCNMQTGTAEGQ